MDVGPHSTYRSFTPRAKQRLGAHADTVCIPRLFQSKFRGLQTVRDREMSAVRNVRNSTSFSPARSAHLLRCCSVVLYCICARTVQRAALVWLAISALLVSLQLCDAPHACRALYETGALRGLMYMWGTVVHTIQTSTCAKGLRKTPRGHETRIRTDGRLIVSALV